MDLEEFKRLDIDDPRKGQLAQQFASEVGARFLRDHQLVVGGRESALEVRGRWNDFPARLKVGLGLSDCEWEMKAPNPCGVELLLYFSPSAIPDVGAFTGAAADENALGIGGESF